MPCRAAERREPSSDRICTTTEMAVRGCCAVNTRWLSVWQSSCSASRSTGPGSPPSGLTMHSRAAASGLSRDRLGSHGPYTATSTSVAPCENRAEPSARARHAGSAAMRRSWAARRLSARAPIYVCADPSDMLCPRRVSGRAATRRTRGHTRPRYLFWTVFTPTSALAGRGGRGSTFPKCPASPQGTRVPMVAWRYHGVRDRPWSSVATQLARQAGELRPIGSSFQHVNHEVKPTPTACSVSAVDSSASSA